eukprot:TRINITY_DN40581_c0_g1_i1.p2 TRINITY_DN40581_c0_g1~~TRINITY_DN40581_c0_g1_i1.p2  ORF type:complete len:113 (+),score=12.91 TRINITY_DN40581_c0_g1_i1:115-453(+)
MEIVLKACYAALRSDGTLTFTTEVMEDGESEKGWIERKSERFAHSTRYVVEVCQQQGFKLEHCERISMRREGKERDGSTDAVADGAESTCSVDEPARKTNFLPAEVFVMRKT